MSAKKILMIIDDDDDDRFFFSQAVKEMGDSYGCIEALSGIQALKALRSKEQPLPHFIFLDLNMPPMNGKQCLQELKNDEQLKNIPVIIYTTSRYQKEVDHVLKMGAAHFLIKPHDIGELRNKILESIESESFRIRS